MGKISKIKSNISVNQEGDACLALFDVFPSPIWKSGIDGKCVWVNRSWCEFTGISLADAVKGDWAVTIHPEDRNKSLRAFARAMKNFQAFKIQYRWKMYNDTYRWVVDQGNPIIDSKGKCLGYIGSVFDVTEQKKIEEMLKRRIVDQDRLNKVMIGRELKMIELKSEISRLKRDKSELA